MVNPSTIKSFFNLLNSNGVNYVLIKNDGELIPYSVEDGSDIDILVNPSDYEKYRVLLRSNGYTEEHGEHDKYFFVYNLRPDIYAKKDDCYFHAYDRFSCVSFTNMGKSRVPLSKCIQDRIWKEKRWDESNQWWIMDDITILLFLIIRSILDKREFRIKYRNEIEKRITLIDSDEFIKICRMVFFNFTPVLIKSIKDKHYDKIIKEYQSFSDY